VLRPQTSPPVTNAVRYPEVVHAYHFGRYVDPNDDLIMHGQHIVYRVEESTRWNLQSFRTATSPCDTASANTKTAPSNVAFSPLPISDAELAEINAQKLATIQIMTEARTLSAALVKFQHAWQQTQTNLQETAVLRIAISNVQKRMDALAAVQKRTQAPPVSTINSSTTNNPDLLTP
jgi:hypothetical protein